MKRNAILFLLLLVVAVLIYFGVIRSERQHEQKNELVLQTTFEEMEQVKIQLKDKKEQLEVQKRGNRWYLTLPFNAASDDLVTSEWLRGLAETKAKELVFDADEKFSASEFGVAEESSRVHIYGKNGAQETVRLSSLPEQEGFNYVYNETQKKLFFVTSLFSQQIAKDPDELRDKRLWQDPNETPKEIQALGGLTQWHLVRGPNGWVERSSLAEKMEEPKIQDYLQQLRDLRTLRIEGSAATPSELAAYGLLTPLLEVRVVGQKTFQFRFGSSEKVLGEYVFVQQVGLPTVYKVFTTSYDKLNQPLKYFKVSP